VREAPTADGVVTVPEEETPTMAPPVSDGYRVRMPTRSRGDGSRRLRVDEVGDCLLVSAGRTRRRGSVVARALPAEEGRVAVVVPPALPPVASVPDRVVVNRRDET
jgi:hypothetical protein